MAESTAAIGPTGRTRDKLLEAVITLSEQMSPEGGLQCGEQYLAIVERIRTSFDSKVSAEATGALVRELASARHQGAEWKALQERFAQWIDGVAADICERTVYIPIFGIDFRLNAEPVPLGRVVFRPRDDAIAEDLYGRLANAWSSPCPPLLEQVPVLATCDIVAENTQAILEGLEHTEEALAILRFAAACHPQTRFGNQPEITSGWQRDETIIAFALPKHSDGHIVKGSRGHFFPLMVDDGVRALLQSQPIARLSAIAGKQDGNHLEKTILRAVRWVALAIQQSDPELFYLSLINALEVLFSQGGEGLALRLADSVAFLVAHQGHRQEAVKAVRNAYNWRSGIVHGTEQSAGIGVDDCTRLLRWVTATIWQVVTVLDKVSPPTKDGLVAYIDGIKYGEAANAHPKAEEAQ